MRVILGSTKQNKAISSFLCLSIMAIVIAWASIAKADASIMPPTRYPTFATFGLGPTVGLTGVGTQLKLQQEIGYHFSGNGSGPALGGIIHESFGGGGWGFEFGGKFWWDFQPSSSLGLYLAPTALLAGVIGGSGGDIVGAFEIQIGFEARAVFQQQHMVYFSPFALDFLIGNGFGMRYNLMFGYGYCF